MPILLLAFLVLAPNDTPPPGPDIDLPAELDICILTAEVCSMDATACDAWGERGICIKQFALCIEPIQAMVVPSCRMDYAWCKLLETPDDEAMLKHCALVVEQCPTLLPYP